MVTSMTGYGRGEVTSGDLTVAVELRSVNSRFLEVSSRLPRSLALRENEIKEIIRRTIVRGKVGVVVSSDRGNGDGMTLKVNPTAARAYYHLLNDLRRTLKMRETVKLQHLLQFSEILKQGEENPSDEKEWEATQVALEAAVADLQSMRRKEGGELENDFRTRIALIEERLSAVEQLSIAQVPRERERLKARIRQLLDAEPHDDGRLEMEIALLADRLDVTEECVRFRSHNKFFLEALEAGDAAGRRLNFLVQEMNREANTIGSKSSAQEIAHRVVGIKEELERIREQVQNIE